MYFSDLGVRRGIEILTLSFASALLTCEKFCHSKALPSLQTFAQPVPSAWNAFSPLVFPANSPSFKARLHSPSRLSLKQSLADAGRLNSYK